MLILRIGTIVSRLRIIEIGRGERRLIRSHHRSGGALASKKGGPARSGVRGAHGALHGRARGLPPGGLDRPAPRRGPGRGCKHGGQCGANFRAFVLSKIGFDTAENEPRKVWITDLSGHLLQYSFAWQPGFSCEQNVSTEAAEKVC